MSKEPVTFEHNDELYSYDYETVTSGEALNAYDIGHPGIVIEDQFFTEGQVKALASLDPTSLNDLLKDLPF